MHAASQAAPVELKLRPMWRVLILLWASKRGRPREMGFSSGLPRVGGFNPVKWASVVVLPRVGGVNPVKWAAVVVGLGLVVSTP